MAGSGLIYAAIVAAWVAYLVPSWVRHSEERTHAERTSERMRILQPGARHAGHEPDEDFGSAQSEVPRVSARTARRRRRTLLLLVVTIAGLIAGVRLGYLLAWAPLIPAAALGGYVVMLRRSTRRLALARRRELARRAVRAVSAPVVHRAVDRPAEYRGVGVSATAVVPPQARAPEPVPDGLWEPRPVPLPTYVTAPKARRAIRSIDLTAPGAWTSGRVSAESQGNARVAGEPQTSETADTGPVPLQAAVGD
jgi:hypothetical protein